jgi:hypothetical protein
MMKSRVLIAGLIGGVAMYLWATIAHMSPLGTVGLSQIADDGPMIASMQMAAGDKPGLYAFPSVDRESNDAMAQYEAKLKTSPSGLLLYHPPGAKGMQPSQLIGELVLELFEAVLAVWLLSLTTLNSFTGRAGFVAAVGVIAAVTTNASYWIWYGFPADFTVAAMVIELGKYLFAGLAAAAVLGFRRKAAPA